MPRSLLSPLKALGPGLVVAAAGIGAGDVITATVTGAQFGTGLAWALLVCVVLKFVLNEGLARWQLATGSTVIEACARRLPRWVSVSFFLYLLVWTFFVSASLTNACGLAGHSLFPQLPVWAWGVIHSVVAAALVWAGRFGLFENVMKLLVGIMVITVLICAVLVKPHLGELLRHLVWPALPPDFGKSVLSIMGGIGGSMTMLCYGYWIRENAWTGAAHQRVMRADLLLAYGVTLIFAVALTIVAAGCNAVVINGSGMALEVATRLEATLGPAGRWAFLIGFWSAVFAAMLGVWQGVPYFFADFVAHRSRSSAAGLVDLKKSRAYRGYLLYLAGPPLVLLLVGKPVAMVVLFTVIGAFFMPFLAAVLLYLNNRRDWMGSLRNGIVCNLALLISLLLFGWIAITEIFSIFSK
ncbi:MAG: Nramp family divalent metal transporter [Prosthecobacter sp.]|nr:Nramp family divalent metal transporter [Prosthecobacter sp.]